MLKYKLSVILKNVYSYFYKKKSPKNLLKFIPKNNKHERRPKKAITNELLSIQWQIIWKTFSLFGQSKNYKRKAVDSKP